MKYIKTFESLREDFDKENKEIKQKSVDLVNKTKETVDEFMFSLTDEYDNSDSKWNYELRQSYSIKDIDLGIVIRDKPTLVNLRHSDWDGNSNIATWYHENRIKTQGGLTKRIAVESLFSITYSLKCKYSNREDGFRLYDERDNLDNFIDELESTTQRIKEVLGLEYKILARYSYTHNANIGYHEHNHMNPSDLILLKAELAYQKEIDTYQNEKFGKPHGVGYNDVEIIIEFL